MRSRPMARNVQMVRMVSSPSAEPNVVQRKQVLSSSPEGKKTFLAPKRKREVHWRPKPRRVARKFSIVTPSARNTSRPTEQDIFEDLVRKHTQDHDVGSQLLPVATVVPPNKSIPNAALEGHSSSILKVVPTPMGASANAANVLHSTDKTPLPPPPPYHIAQSSGQHECVSMELTCSSSLKCAQDTMTPAIVTPAILHTLEAQSKAKKIDVSRVRYFLEHLACGGMENSSSHSVGMSTIVPTSPHGGNLEGCVLNTSHLPQGRDTAEGHKEVIYLAILSKSNTYLAAKGSAGVPGEEVEGGVPGEEVEGGVPGEEVEIVATGEEVEGGVPGEEVKIVVTCEELKDGGVGGGDVCKEQLNSGQITEAIPNMACDQNDQSSLSRTLTSDSSIEVVRARGSDDVILNDCKETILLQDSIDESIGGLYASGRAFQTNGKAGSKEEVGGAKEEVGGAKEEVGGANKTTAEELGGTNNKTIVNTGRANKTVAMEAALSTSGQWKKKLSLSRKPAKITPLCSKHGTLNTPPSPPTTSYPTDCMRQSADRSLNDHFKSLHLTPILSLSPLSPSQQGDGLPLTSTPLITPITPLITPSTPVMSATPIPKPLPLTSTPVKVRATIRTGPSRDTSTGSTMERLMDFDEIGFDASTSIQSSPSHSQPSPSHSTVKKAVQRHYRYTPRPPVPRPTACKKITKHRSCGLVMKKKRGFPKNPKPPAVQAQGCTPPGTTPPPCVLIRLHERANQNTKMVQHRQCAFEDVPEDVLVTIVTRVKRPH